jgi:hypothetical protein
MHKLILQRTEEALDRCIVVAVAFATHARDHAAKGEELLIEPRAILNALIAVMDQSRRRASLTPRLCHHREDLPATHGPADNASRVAIQHDRHIESPGAGRHERAVGGPHAILPRHGKLLIQPIGDRGRLLLPGLDGPHIPSAA